MNPSQMVNQMIGRRGPAGGNYQGNAAGQSSRNQSAGEIIPKGYSKGRLQNFDPQQNDLYSSLFSYLGPDSQLAQLAGGNADWNAIEAPAWQQFQQAQGQLGSRFSGLGMGSQKGSGFQNAAGQLGSDFAMKLASQRQGLMRQALQDLMGMSNTLLGQRPYENDLFENPQKQQKKALGGWGSTLGSIGGGVGGFLLGGPMGAFAGANIGGNAFSGL